ncbi:MAG: hypothetical protein PHT33_09690, partial [bacterium]|nr:hypothetical protein [bacterium]
LWSIDERFYWTQYGDLPHYLTGIVCLAYDITADFTYAAYVKYYLEGTFLRHAGRIRKFADFNFAYIRYGAYIPRLMAVVADAMKRDPDTLAEAETEWRRKREAANRSIYDGPGIDLDKDDMDANGNILNRPPVDLPRLKPVRARNPVVNLGILSTEDHL